MKKLTLFLWLLALPAFSDQVRVRDLGEAKIFAVLTQDGDKFLVQITREEPHRLPILLENLAFQSYDSAMRAFVIRTALGWHDFVVDKQIEDPALEVLDDSLWPITQTWSFAWEQKYNEWVRVTIDPDFYTTDVKTDCADVIYATRWIFARNHGLPMVSRLGGSGKIFSHHSLRQEWQNLPTHTEWRKDKRFLAALDYLLQMTYTSALNGDTYPILISPEWLTPGVQLSYPHGEAGHNFLIAQVTDGKRGELPIQMLYSTTPRDYRQLMTADFIEPTQPTSGGFRRFRWPQAKTDGTWTLVAATQMPGHSLEQFSPEFASGQSFDEAVYDRVAPGRTVDYRRKMMSLLEGIALRFAERVQIVENGFTACYPNRCPEGSRSYEDWSTPSRDQRLGVQIAGAQQMAQEHQETRWDLDLFLGQRSITVLDRFHRPVELRMEELFTTWQKHSYSSDPNVHIEARWGF